MTSALPMKKQETDLSGKYRVLVIDDHRDSAQTVVWTIEMLGHDAIMAQDGPTALQVGRSFRPDLVLLDLSMPGMNGYEVCQAMRRDPAYAHTVFVAQTGWEQRDRKQHAGAESFDRYLVKPIQIEDLKAVFSALADPEKDIGIAKRA